MASDRHASTASANRRRRPSAFTLFEILVVLSIMSMVMILVIPTMNDDARARVRAAATVLISDIEMAQVLTIAQPSDPTVVRFDPAGGRYWLERTSNPGKPMFRDDTGDPYLVVLGTGRAAAADSVALAVSGLAGSRLEFNALGGLVDPTIAPSITLSRDRRWIRIDVANTTGSLTDLEGAWAEATDAGPAEAF